VVSLSPSDWVWAFSINSMYVFTKKKYLSMYFYPLSRIHNTSFTSAYFGLDKHECECVEYLLLFIIRVVSCGVRDKIKE
jgi:hypothetical protein